MACMYWLHGSYLRRQVVERWGRGGTAMGDGRAMEAGEHGGMREARGALGATCGGGSASARSKDAAAQHWSMVGGAEQSRARGKVQRHRRGSREIEEREMGSGRGHRARALAVYGGAGGIE